MKTSVLTSVAVLVAASFVLQLVPFPVDPTMGVIRIDPVGVPWVLAYFLFGLQAALLTSVATALLISIYSWGGGFIGATMKFCATVPMFTAPYIVTKVLKKTPASKDYEKILAISIIPALALRAIITVFLNYWVFGPIFFSTTAEELMQWVPVWALILYNSIIGTIDYAFAFLLMKYGRLKERFGI